MADQELAALTEETAPADDYLFYATDNAGTINRKVQLSNLRTAILASIAETIDDRAAALFAAGSGITLTYNDPAGTLTVATTISQYTDEQARDALGTALTAGTGITITPNDGADTITVATTITQYTDEMARDALGAALTAGAGIVITPNDGADTITVTAEVTQAELDAVSGAIPSTEAIQDLVGAMATDGVTVNFSYDDTAGTFTAEVQGLTSASLSNFTEAVQDVVGALGLGGAALAATYDDTANTLVIDVNVDGSSIEVSGDALRVKALGVTNAMLAGSIALSKLATDPLARANHTGSQLSTTISDFAEAVQDAVGAMATDGTTVNFTYDDTAGTLTAEVQGLTSASLSDFAEAVRDRVGATIVQGTGITVTVDDPGDTITIATTITQYTDEMAQDAVGGILTDTATIDFTYSDAGNQITADVKDASITAAKVAADVATQAELDAEAALARNGDNITSGTVADARIASTIARDSEVTSAVAAEATARDAAIATHEADTTSVHGIADTSTLYRSGGTDVAVADGGTGSSTATGARVNLDAMQRLTPTAVKTGNYTAAAGELVPCDTSGGAFTLTFPTAPADGTLVAVKLVTAGSTLNLALGGSDVFNKTGGSTTGSLSGLNQAIICQYKASGAIWYVIADDLPKTYLDTLYQAIGSVSDAAYDATGWNGDTTHAPSKNAVRDQVELLAPIASPALTGHPTGVTESAGDNSTRLATTAYADASSSTAATAKVSDTAYAGSWDGVTTVAPSKNAVYDQIQLLAPLASPALTGNPTAPTASTGDNDTSIATTAFVQTAQLVAIPADKTADYTLVLGDAGSSIGVSSATAKNVTVPLNSSVAYPIGTMIEVRQVGAGQVTIVATGGVTLRSAGGALKIRAQYGAVSLLKIDTDTFSVQGDLTT